MSGPYKRLETQVVHAGDPRPRIDGAIEMPIFQSATFEYRGEARYDDVRYLRLNNSPNHLALHAKLAALEGAQAALVTASGMAAITTTLLTVLCAGDHLLAQSGLYGGTHDFVTREFAGLGLSAGFIDADRPDTWKAQLKPNTRAIYVEAMTNPLLQVADLAAVVEFARAHGLVTLIDNTFASPVNFRPIAAGFDLALHSATKYLNGHSDIVAGAVIGRSDLIERIRHKANHLGGTLDPHAAFLLNRGLKTLVLRVRYQNDSTLRLAQFLEAHPAVTRVHYAGLASHPRHERARRLFTGFGGVLSFELQGGAARADEFASRVRIPAVAPSLGGVHTLLTRPATTSHSGLTREDRLRLGITDGLLRLSVGIESTDDLIEDFTQALA
ncbi:MAG TPA: aminotransferase class I/II-fold pyridoxal phosphate-dependent enzyme [Steroidobacteraceae bacterium]|nr:aminotransferase class I/II-fold pyridoxal phosphate-dependent enzyme [Gammaproteobacteria bacterium]HEV2285595.1 aminotransferase class I/II-fold pyridoxal phosphate-dependent enzyme [Steroidobacteraceae bacterium]